MPYPRDIIFGQKGTKSPLLHQRLDVKRVSLKAVIFLPTDPRGTMATTFGYKFPLVYATGNQLVTRSFTASNPRWHLLLEEIQKSPLPELGANEKFPPWATSFVKSLHFAWPPSHPD